MVGAQPSALIGIGFGNASNLYASAMAVYENQLYVGTFSWGGCEVWSFDGANWTQTVGAQPSALIGPGFGTACIVVESMRCFGINLCAGTGSPGGGEVWLFDGAAWHPLASADPAALIGTGFGNANNTDVTDMEVYGTSLYAGTYNGFTGCEVWDFNGVAWTQVVGAQPGALIGSGFGNAGNVDASVLRVYDSRLFAGTENWTAGCEVWSFDGANWTQEVGWGAPGTYEAPGFGDPNNAEVSSAAVFNNRLYTGTFNNVTGCAVFALKSSTTWYLAEGATDGGFETWVLVQNPNPHPVDIAVTFQTGSGEVAGPADTIPARSRRSYEVSRWAVTNDVSTKVTSTAGGYIICERAVYWRPSPGAVRYLGTDSIGYDP